MKSFLLVVNVDNLWAVHEKFSILDVSGARDYAHDILYRASLIEGGEIFTIFQIFAV